MAERRHGASKPPDPKDWWGPMLGEPTTPRSLLDARRLRLMVQCEACHHQQDADLKALVAAGRGDVPLAKLRFRCSRCGSRKTDRSSADRHRASA